MVLGVLVLISPWSGLPLVWLSWILPAIGVIVVVIGLSMRSRRTPPQLPESSEPRDDQDIPRSRSSHIAFS